MGEREQPGSVGGHYSLRGAPLVNREPVYLSPFVSENDSASSSIAMFTARTVT
jgi:hypothetical protein